MCSPETYNQLFFDNYCIKQQFSSLKSMETVKSHSLKTNTALFYL